MKSWLALIVAVAVLSFTFVLAEVPTQFGNGKGSLRIVLSVADNAWTLESVTPISEQSLNQPAIAKGRFSISLEDRDGNAIYHSYLGYPELLFYDSPDSSGDLGGGYLVRDTFTVTFVIPYDNRFERMLINDEKGITGFSVDRGELELASKVKRTPMPIFSMDTIQWHGNSANNLDIVILGDGFRIEDTALFRTMVYERFVPQMMEFPPYPEFSERFNLYVINTISAESGVDHPDLNIFRDTYFDSYYFGGRIIIVPEGKPEILCSENIPAWDQIWMLVNDPVYGGAGGDKIATSYTGDVGVLIHEFAHSFGQLADEYSYGGIGESGEFINCDADNVNPVWQRWIDAGTPLVGAYPPCTFDNYYAPTNGICIMRRLNRPYCVVCQERIVNRIYDYARNPIKSASPEPVLLFDPGAIQQFSVSYANQANHPLELTWSVDGVVYPESTGTSFTMALELDTIYSIEVSLYDPTPMVLNMADSILTTAHRWVAVANSQALCGDADTDLIVSISDAVYLIQYIFSGGSAPFIPVRSDVNCDGFLNISDVVYLIAYIFSSGPAPCSAC